MANESEQHTMMISCIQRLPHATSADLKTLAAEKPLHYDNASKAEESDHSPTEVSSNPAQ